MPRQAIAVDIGGTKITTAQIVDGKRIACKLITRTPQRVSADRLISLVQERIESLGKEAGIRLVGIATAGIVDHERGVAKFAVNLPWNNTPLKSILAKRLGISVAVDNDARIAALGEYEFGERKKPSSMFLLTVGTGVGGAFVVNGRVLRGFTNSAGEVGHICIDIKGPRCKCGSVGCLDLYISGRALEEEARHFLKIGETVIPEGQSPVDYLCKCARDGETRAQSIFDKIGRDLGMGLVNIANTFNPEEIVLTGGLFRSWDLISKSSLSTFRGRFFPAISGHIKIRLSNLENDAVLLGCSVLAGQDLEGA